MKLTLGVLTFCFLGDFSFDPKNLAKNPLPSTLVFSTLSYIVSLCRVDRLQTAYVDGDLLGFILLLLWLLDYGLGSFRDRSGGLGLLDLWLDSGGLVGSTVDLGSCLRVDMGGTRLGVGGSGLFLDLYVSGKSCVDRGHTTGSALMGSEAGTARTSGAATASGSPAMTEVVSLGSSTAMTGASKGASATGAGAAVDPSARTGWEVERDR